MDFLHLIKPKILKKGQRSERETKNHFPAVGKIITGWTIARPRCANMEWIRRWANNSIMMLMSLIWVFERWNLSFSLVPTACFKYLHYINHPWMKAAFLLQSSRRFYRNVLENCPRRTSAIICFYLLKRIWVMIKCFRNEQWKISFSLPSKQWKVKWKIESYCIIDRRS